MENKQDQTSYRCDNIYLTTVTDGTIGLSILSKSKHFDKKLFFPFEKVQDT